MEVVLQWLDELDDLVFAGLTLWQRLRRLCLGIAVTAAAGLLAVPVFDIPSIGAPVFAVVTLVALASWTLFAAIGSGAAHSRHSMSSGA